MGGDREWGNLWVVQSKEAGVDRICPSGQILTSVVGLGAPNLATQSCAAGFGGAAPSSPIWAAASYPGEGEYFPLSLNRVAAHPNPRLDMEQAC